MNKEELKRRISKLLNVSDDSSEAVFSKFKEKLAQFLSVGEALKIEDLGIFQLKEQFGQSKLHDTGHKDLTLLFSAESDENSSDSLFITIELEKKNKDDSEFDESVFQIGVGKQMVTSSDKITFQEDSEIEGFEQRISELLNKSEKITDFDLWEDHLKSKESKNILEDEILSMDDEAEEVEKDVLSEDFVTMNEEELLEDYEEDHKLVSHELNDKLLEDIEIEDNLSNRNIDFEIEDDSEDTDDLVEQVSESEENISEELELEEKYPLDKTELDKIELEEDLMEESESITEKNEVKTSKLQESDSFEEPTKFQEEFGEKIDDEIKELGIVEEEITETAASTSKVPESRVEKSKGNKSMVIFLIAAFIIVGAISSYYLLFMDSTEENSGSENISHIESSSKSDTEESIDLENKTELEAGSIETNIDKITGSEDQSKIKNEESEVSQSVFYDGSVYNVQVSSWKQRLIAEREVNKLIKKGYPAFILKVYIPKFNGTWNRVRVGPYNSITEAKAVRDKLNK